MDALGSGVVALAVLISLGVGVLLGFLLGVYLGYRKMRDKTSSLAARVAYLEGDKADLRRANEQLRLSGAAKDGENVKPGPEEPLSQEETKEIVDTFRELSRTSPDPPSEKPENPILQLLGFVAGRVLTEKFQSAEYVKEQLDRLVPIGHYNPKRGEEIINAWIDDKLAGGPDPPVAEGLEQLRLSMLDMHRERHGGAQAKPSPEESLVRVLEETKGELAREAKLLELIGAQKQIWRVAGVPEQEITIRARDIERRLRAKLADLDGAV